MEQLPSDFYEVKFNQLEKRLIMDAFTIYTTVLLSLVVALVTDSYEHCENSNLFVFTKLSYYILLSLNC